MKEEQVRLIFLFMVKLTRLLRNRYPSQVDEDAALADLEQDFVDAMLEE